jgi:hypothetical protein
MTPLRAVAAVAMLLLLWGAGCQRHATVDPRAADICAAAQAGDTDKVKSLLAGGLSSNVKGPKGYGPLHFAAKEGQVTVAKLLLGHGADVDAREDRGRTPLHLAAQGGHKEVVKLLVDYGADVHAKDDRGCTPVDLPAPRGRDGQLHGLLTPAQPMPSEGPPPEVRPWQVWVVDVASGEKQLVADGNSPLWCPDGSLLGFNSHAPDDGVRGIFVGAISVWDGESIRRIARISSSPTDFAWTSDSGHLMIEAREFLGERKPGGLLLQVSVADPGLRKSLGPACILDDPWRDPPAPHCEVAFGSHGQRYVLPPPPDASPSQVRQRMREEIEAWIAQLDNMVTSGRMDQHTADEFMAELDAAVQELDEGDDGALGDHMVAFQRLLAPWAMKPTSSTSPTRQMIRLDIERCMALVRILVAAGAMDQHTADEFMGELDAAVKELDQGNDAAARNHVAAFSTVYSRWAWAYVERTLSPEQAAASSRPVGWTADGRVLLIVVGPAEPPAWVRPQRLVVQSAGGGESELVCELPADVDRIHWTSDLSHLAIARDQSGMEKEPGSSTYAYVERHTLKILDLRKKAETDLGQGQYPHWSPDGEWLLYAEPLSQEQGRYGDRLPELCMVDAQGGSKRVIAHARGGDWSPDSRRVAYSVPPSARLNRQD